LGTSAIAGQGENERFYNVMGHAAIPVPMSNGFGAIAGGRVGRPNPYDGRSYNVMGQGRWERGMGLESPF